MTPRKTLALAAPFAFIQGMLLADMADQRAAAAACEIKQNFNNAKEASADKMRAPKKPHAVSLPAAKP